jgi:hypothetical protein
MSNITALSELQLGTFLMPTGTIFMPLQLQLSSSLTSVDEYQIDQ